eukprot:601399-Pyramimonas_sp.AAC.1
MNQWSFDSASAVIGAAHRPDELWSAQRGRAYAGPARRRRRAGRVSRPPCKWRWAPAETMRRGTIWCFCHTSRLSKY